MILAAAVGLAAYLYLNRSNPTDFTDPDGVFSARFPNPPQSEAVSKAQPLIMKWGEQLHRASVGRTEYAVAVVDGVNTGDQPYGPASRDAHIDGVVTVVLANGDGQILFERPVTHEGHPAREVVFVRRESGKLTALRVLAGEGHVLRLAVTGSGDRDKPTEFLDRAGEFFAGVKVGTGFGPPIVDEPPTVTAADLAAAYKADAGSADAKYRGRWLQVTGSVRKVAEDRTEFALEAGESEVLVRRGVRGRQTVQVRGPGARVVVTGKCRGMEAGPQVLLDEAIVARTPPPK